MRACITNVVVGAGVGAKEVCFFPTLASKHMTVGWVAE